MASSKRVYSTEATLFQRVKSLKQLTQRMDTMQMQVDALAEDIALDIIGGWSTGDPLLDFVLVACNGTYDSEVEEQYRALSHFVQTSERQQMLIVQKGEYWDEDGLLILRTMHMATLRQDSLAYDTDTLSLGIPVEEEYLTWREYFKDGLLVSSPSLVSRQRLTVGPLYNMYTSIGNAGRDENGLVFVPDGACAEIELLPCRDHEGLFQQHGVDSQHLNQLYRTWIRARSTYGKVRTMRR